VDYVAAEERDIKDIFSKSLSTLLNIAKEDYHLVENRPDNLFAGKLTHYKELDKLLKLPFGTSKRLLKGVVLNYRISIDYPALDTVYKLKLTPKVLKEFDHCIRFIYEIAKKDNEESIQD
jgi:hypothetical protein